LKAQEAGKMHDDMQDEKARAQAWFRALRDEIVAAFEALEDKQESGPFAEQPPGRFDVTETRRAADGDGNDDAGGGLMSVLRGGRVFEKVGVNVSTVYGELGERAQAAMAARKGFAGMKADPRFWASGISLVAHMQNPHTPAVHMNTRMFWTPHGWWFGGGSDLNPCIEYAEDTAHFHAVQQEHCDRHDAAFYPRFKAWAD
jgi:coproporphyrinogen III oxidase